MKLNDIRISLMDTPTFVNLLMSNSLEDVNDITVNKYKVYTRKSRLLINDGVTRNLKKASVIVDCMTTKKIFKVESKFITQMSHIDKQNGLLEFLRDHIDDIEEYYAFKQL